MQRDNKQLTVHFSLFELTCTNAGDDKQRLNRDLTDAQVEKLTALAWLGEKLRTICGSRPLRVHSGYRSPALNANTKGASSTSQHPLCEAIDFDVEGLTIDEAFDLIRAAAKSHELAFGQLIIECADRGYQNADGTEAISRWVHCSVHGSLPPEKRGLIMRMSVDENGQRHTDSVEKVEDAPSVQS